MRRGSYAHDSALLRVPVLVQRFFLEILCQGIVTRGDLKNCGLRVGSRHRCRNNPTLFRTFTIAPGFFPVFIGSRQDTNLDFVATTMPVSSNSTPSFHCCLCLLSGMSIRQRSANAEPLPSASVWFGYLPRSWFLIASAAFSRYQLVVFRWHALSRPPRTFRREWPNPKSGVLGSPCRVVVLFPAAATPRCRTRRPVKRLTPVFQDTSGIFRYPCPGDMVGGAGCDYRPEAMVRSGKQAGGIHPEMARRNPASDSVSARMRSGRVV